MQELIGGYLSELVHERRVTQRARARVLSDFAAYCVEQNLSLSDLQLSHLREYIEKMSWTPGKRGLLADATIVQAGLMTRAFLHWALLRLELPADWLREWVLGRPARREPRLLSREQVEAILAQPPSNPIGFRNRAMLAIICEHAVFAIGLAGMDLADLDLSRYQLLGKPLSAELTEKLQRYLQKGRPALLARPEEQALFLSRVGTRIKPITITKMVGTCAGAGDVGARLLWRSWQIHRQALRDRRLPGF
ncbi:MAG: hypothetical protein U0931_29175 [Vulcanimicrobiota bacterium]